MNGGPLCCALLALIGSTVVLSDHHGDHPSQLPAGDHAAQLPATASVTSHDDDHHGDHVEAFSDIDHRIDKLTARIEHIRHRIHQRTDPHRRSKGNSARVRVQKLEGSGCDDRHFQCGGTDPECQSYLFVCDGRKDCRNGADEEHCELPTKNGDYFEGQMIWDTCTQRKPDIMGFEITSVKTSTFFTPVAMVTANILLEYEDHRLDGHASLPTVGGYHFGRRTIGFRAPEADGLALFCKFDGFNMDRCEGFIAHETSLNKCAELIFVRKHDD